MWRKRHSPTNFAAGTWRRPSRPRPLTTGPRSGTRILWRAWHGRYAVGFRASGNWQEARERMSFQQRNLSAGQWRNVAIALATLGLLAAVTSCSSGPQPPQPGTPAFFWAAAKETYRGGDYPKTSEHLQRILASENEFTARARAWDTVISGGVAQIQPAVSDQTCQPGKSWSMAASSSWRPGPSLIALTGADRSEERRVGKESRS